MEVVQKPIFCKQSIWRCVVEHMWVVLDSSRGWGICTWSSGNIILPSNSACPTPTMMIDIGSLAACDKHKNQEVNPKYQERKGQRWNTYQHTYRYSKHSDCLRQVIRFGYCCNHIYWWSDDPHRAPNDNMGILGLRWNIITWACVHVGLTHIK